MTQTSKDKNELAPETLAAQASKPDPATGAVIPPVHFSTTFARDENYAPVNPKHVYIRDQNPTFEAPERLLQTLEGGSDALLFSSGMTAAMTVAQALKPGDHIVVPEIMYWALRNWLDKFCSTWGLRLSKIDLANPATNAKHIHAALEPRAKDSSCTQVLWLETPANPMWDVVDLREACTVAHSHGAIVCADSTVSSPVITRPIEHGVDIVMHSATKYLNGHSDVIAGVLISKQPSDLWQRIKRIRSENGAILGAFEAWLLQRGLRTLFLRVQRASESALRIAQYLETHPQIEEVLYPGLVSHPGHSIAARQMENGFGGMLSVRVKGGAEAALTAIGRMQVFVRATSLGGVESLVEHRPSIEGPTSPLPPELIRISIGIEDPADLIADLDQALSP